MKIGMTGLGRMGLNMRERLRAGGVEVVGFDVNEAVRDVASLEELVAALPTPRVVWMMLPLAPIEPTLDSLAGLLSQGDVIVDGGNSHWEDSRARHQRFSSLGISYVDVGTSNGIWGREAGYGLMVGGDDDAVAILRPVFDALTPADGGFVHAGPSGAGHRAKAYHNAAEYTMMQGFAEVYDLMRADPDISDPAAVFAAWQDGTVIRSFLVDLCAKALAEEGAELSGIAGVAADSGEGRWTLAEAVRLGVPVPALAASMFTRFESQRPDSPAMQLVAALRAQFGGHALTRRSAAADADSAVVVAGGDAPDSTGEVGQLRAAGLEPGRAVEEADAASIALAGDESGAAQ